ncbi:hypothetical protein Hanom_Chr12g01169391 [Helianthus anomalus]
MQNYYRAGLSLEAVSLFLRGRDKVVYVLPSSDPTLALLLVGFTEYDDDNDDDQLISYLRQKRLQVCHHVGLLQLVCFSN